MNNGASYHITAERMPGCTVHDLQLQRNCCQFPVGRHRRSAKQPVHN